MNKVAHILKPNAARKLPKWVIFFDTETYEEHIDAKTKKLRLRLGYAVLTRRTKLNEFKRVSDVTFLHRDEFARWLASALVGRERYYLVAHNIGFDVRIVALFDELAASGWNRTLFIDDNINFIARFRKGDTTLKVINNQQLFNMSLRNLGESIGTYKSAVDFATANDAELLEYCIQDVEVMVQAWNKWVQFIYDNDLGNFQITAASQSFSAFRHRFMPAPIFIHNHPKATELERESYHGGRVECFYIGEKTGEPIYYLDVNSMYPYEMREREVPVKLLKYYDKLTIDEFEGIRSRFGYIVEASLEIREPRVPVVHDGRLCFPVGTITGVFTKPELEYALEVGTLRNVRRVSLYDEQKLFAPFVEFFYGARRKYKEEGNVAFATISKLLMNSLYGKFAQKQLEYKKVGKTKDMPDGYYNVAWKGGKEYCKVRVINGVIERANGYQEGFNSFVAIASYITANARVHLSRLIDIAGRSHVLYCDTDSLFVDEVGYRALFSEIDSVAIGKLKCEGVEQKMTIRAPKWYKFGDKLVSKGIRKDAHELAPLTFEQDKFVSWRGAVRANDTDGVIVKRVRKTLNPHYLKGIVSATGLVSPLVLQQEFPLPSTVSPPIRKSG